MSDQFSLFLRCVIALGSVVAISILICRIINDPMLPLMKENNELLRELNTLVEDEVNERE